KAVALAKMKANEQAEGTTPPGSDDADLAKKKAAAAAKAKAAALAKMKANEQAEGGGRPADDGDLAKKKAAAAAKAKAAAAAKAKAAALGAEDSAGGAGNDEKAKAIAAAKAKAAAAAKAKAAAAAKAGGKQAGGTTGAEQPSINQPLLDKYVKVITDHLGEEVLEDFYINNLSKDVPTLVVRKDAYYKVAEFLKYNERLSFEYLSELHGTDFETHMELYVHLYSYKNRQPVALKTKIDREQPVADSLQPLWQGANWPECEAYDLLGIQFTGHPNLHRILLGEEWVGHPMRKDYEPYDVEV
ncbi:NADH-quinone oxidoreductase subunit C, partial [Bacillus sp. T33-2]|uniref:NADH-quinone oxidoreductase subunit C n=1 Tax=Bacillus sp. T33-2 TaxID=2054168 RepID=UPI000C778D3D